ncbi:MAG: CoA pyrophosphatase [Bacteroidetes bacterium]|nr:MAG: CoA pyrophosphatase [Bacteroidota bacterium]
MPLPETVPHLPLNPDWVASALRRRMQRPLPGLDAQMEMSPPIRGREVEVPPDARLSAVLMLLYPHRGAWYLPFMRRTVDGRVHSGQVCFPGGRRDPGDPDYTFTALREAEEEMHILPAQVEIIGPLTELYIPPSRSLVYPRLGVATARPDFIAEPGEVAEIIEVPLAELFDPARRAVHRVDVHQGWEIEAPGYTFGAGDLVWGGTAMMLAELSVLIQEIPAFQP